MPTQSFDKNEYLVDATATSNLMVQLTSDNEDVVKVEGHVLKFVGVGTVNITATQSGNVAWNAAESVTKTFTVTKGIQTITFADLPIITLGDQPIKLNATATSGLEVSFQVQDNTIASVANAELTALKEGKTTVTAAQEGNDLWLAAEPVSQELTVLSLPDMKVVNVVTPNGDGENDVLVIKEIERYKENHVRVFNRLGQVLFETDNYDNTNKVFAGRDASNRVLTDGTYFYKLEWTVDGKKYQQTGWFYLKK